MAHTAIGIPAPRAGSAPAPTRSLTPSNGRYSYALPAAFERPARDLSLADIRAALHAATDDALRAVRDNRSKDAEKFIRDAQLLGRSLRRFEIQQERARLAGGR
jgi:hypothetical protein